MTSPSADAGVVAGIDAPTRRQRFDAVERAVHWSTAALVAVCGATAIALSVGPVSTVVGRRDLVKTVHVVAGLLLVVPFAVGRAGPWSARLRADLRQLDRFDDDDRRWLRSLGRPTGRGSRLRTANGANRANRANGANPAKFHPGQKLNAAASAAAIVALIGTGVVLWQFEPFPLAVRRGATFVHDWTAFLFGFLVLAHIAVALNDRESLRGMVRGTVDRRWAARAHPRWHEPTP